jgi:hypothetical protein
VLAPLSVIAVWTKNTLLDTDQYVSTVAPLAKDPAIIDAAAIEITNALVSEKDVSAKIKNALPARADFIAPAVATALETVVHRLAVRVMSSDRFPTVWERANRRAHAQVVDVLTGNGGRAITTRNGEVAVNLSPVVDRVRKRLSSLGVDIFSGANAKRVSPRIVLFQSDDLKTAPGGDRPAPEGRHRAADPHVAPLRRGDRAVAQSTQDRPARRARPLDRDAGDPHRVQRRPQLLPGCGEERES